MCERHRDVPREGRRAELWHQILDASGRVAHFPSRVLPVPEDLTPEEQQELENIRRRKQELLEDIQVTQAWNIEKKLQHVQNKDVCKCGSFKKKKSALNPLTAGNAHHFMSNNE